MLASSRGSWADFPDGVAQPERIGFVEQGDRGIICAELEVMLLCDVFLGRPKVLRSANNRLQNAAELHPSCFGKLFWPKRTYDSVYVPGGVGLCSCAGADLLRCCHAVRVSEFVVYDPMQAVPRYVIEFDIELMQSN
mmetsp:Transcript_74970/g.181207  ORF Transcript_74970/g.181207 Transcript_74970/m.181207 type:complete len:137 (+) Transcript_74970:273-683(+)